ncbi:hypothetical protein GQX73_g1422 [Xylaria multiplex]|uniref:Transcription factor domain-containing protein n=1 Tax=Xylaria multiplex TaxID=323545 RepID=A0A7C8IVS2_9PEZI|nr:hypothetical protein GQX73_g1422 [Xylaria multiplex]
MQRSKYPRILPAVPTTLAGQPSTSGNSSSTGKDSKKRPLSQPRPGACFDCRTRKSKAKRLINGHNAIELVELLKSLREESSAALLKRLREKGDAAVVVAEFRGGANESDFYSSRFESRDSRRHRGSLEDELMTNNSKVFPALSPIDPIVLARSSLLRPTPPGPSFVALSLGETTIPQATPLEYPEPLDKPVEYCDERLQYLQVGFWTNINVSNDFAAKVISAYIITDHPLLGLFDSHLFIDDLVGQKTNYCSRFLFHALMSLGFQTYSSFDQESTQYVSEFSQTAEALWETQKDSYSSMAGAILLSISLLGHGDSHDVLRYTTDALRMGTRLGLFCGSIYQPSVDTINDDLRAQCYAAWGVFNWNVITSMFYRQPGSESPASAPTVPIPGEIYNKMRTGKANEEVGGIEEGEEYGEYDDDNPSEDIFPVLCNFWRLLHEARWIYYTVDPSPPIYLREVLVEYAYRELIAWVGTIPSFFLRRDHNPHYVMVFHIWLHAAILDMWQPFIYNDAPDAGQLRTFSARDNTMGAAYTASVNQLKQLVVEYRSRYAASKYSILWHNGLIYLANAMLRGTDPEWHIYLLLCIYGYERLGHTYRISEVIGRALLVMTMRNTQMSGTEASKIMEELKMSGIVHVNEGIQDRIRATFMADLTLALTNPEAANVENMANEFSDLATFQDLIYMGDLME